jgi:hypothetical protein
MGGSTNRGERPVTGSGGSSDLRALRVVWIDDDEYVRGYAASYLAERGIVVRVAATGAERLRWR